MLLLKLVDSEVSSEDFRDAVFAFSITELVSVVNLRDEILLFGSVVSISFETGSVGIIDFGSFRSNLTILRGKRTRGDFFVVVVVVEVDDDCIDRDLTFQSFTFVVLLFDKYFDRPPLLFLCTVEG